MKKLFSGCLALGLAACGGDSNNPPNNNPDAMETNPADAMVVDPNVIELRGDLAGDQHWTAAKEIYLRETVFLTSGTLTIDPGSVIKGDPGAALVISRGARINAVGTPTAPILFTAATRPGFRKAGDWGGLVLLGGAPININPANAATDEKIEGFPDSAGDRIRYGGNDAAHDCGELKYVRIEFAGFEIAENNEINGLTMGGCGSATKIEYVQVHRGADDGVEIFGGTVNIKHILITVPDDDGLDTDFGWSGKGQFIIVQQGANRGNNGFEWDNRNNVPNALPRNNPQIYNATLIGSNANFGGSANAEGQRAMVLRRGTAGTIRNLIIMTFNDYPIDIDGADTGGFFLNDPPTGTNPLPLRITNTILWNDPAVNSSTNRKPFPRDADVPPMIVSKVWPLNAPTSVSSAKDPTGSDGMTPDVYAAGVDSGCGMEVKCATEEKTFRLPAYKNSFADPLLTKGIYSVPHDPDFRPTAGSPALMVNGAMVEPAPGGDSFFETVDFLGAMGPDADDDWTKPWAAYPAN
jgi:hypothetical protein